MRTHSCITSHIFEVTVIFIKVTCQAQLDWHKNQAELPSRMPRDFDFSAAVANGARWQQLLTWSDRLNFLEHVERSPTKEKKLSEIKKTSLQWTSLFSSCHRNSLALLRSLAHWCSNDGNGYDLAPHRWKQRSTERSMSTPPQGSRL